MPSVSKKQHNLMAAVAKNPQFAKRVGIKSSVGEHFLQADKGKKFGGGGMAETANEKRIRKEAELENTNQLGLSMKRDSNFRKLKNAVTGEDDFGTSLSAGAVDAGNRKAKELWDRGGVTLGDAVLGNEARQAAREAAAEERREANRAQTMQTINKKKCGGSVKKMASGGSVRGCGCAVKGKTKGRMV